MDHFKHRLCNDRLNPPKGQENQVSTLYIQRGAVDGYETCVSFWQPTEAELATLLAGGSVQLLVLGRTHPPLGLTVHPEGPNPAITQV